MNSKLDDKKKKEKKKIIKNILNHSNGYGTV